MYIQNDDTQKYPICRIQLVVEMFIQNSKKVPKFVKQTNKRKPLL